MKRGGGRPWLGGSKARTMKLLSTMNFDEDVSPRPCNWADSENGNCVQAQANWPACWLKTRSAMTGAFCFLQGCFGGLGKDHQGVCCFLRGNKSHSGNRGWWGFSAVPFFSYYNATAALHTGRF